MQSTKNILHIAALCLLLSFGAAQAQTRVGLTVAQSVSDDWKQGQRLAYEIGILFETKKEFRIDTLPVSFEFKFGLGIIHEKMKDSDYEFVRPTDNLLFSEIVLKYPLGWTLDPFISAAVSTQVTESFMIMKNIPKATSSLWDPVISQQSLGLAYSFKDANNTFGSRIGISLKQTRANHYTTLTDDFKTLNVKEKYKPDAGLQWKTECVLQLDSMVKYTGVLDSFGTYKEPDKWSFIWTNDLQITLVSSLAVIFKIGCSYDEKQAKRLQYNQNFRFGIVVNL